MHTSSHKQNGITLIEILVALALSLTILAGVIHIFLNNKQTYRVQEAFARIQENGRFAMQLLAKDIRMAGYIGCGGKLTADDVKVTADLALPRWEADEVALFSPSGIKGFNSTELPVTLSDTISLTSADVAMGTDIIQIKRASTTGVGLYGNLQSDNAKVQVNGAIAFGLFQEDDYLFLSDCKNADIFVAGTVTPNPTTITIPHAADKNTQPLLFNHYGEDAEIYKFVNNTYYIGKNDADEFALFRRALINAGQLSKEELVEGIEDMQVLYGEDTDGDGVPNKFRANNLVDDWDNIVAARIELRVRSLEDNLAREEDSFHKDRRLRRTFTTSIAIRNRAI